MVCNLCNRSIGNQGAFERHIKTCSLIISKVDEIIELYVSHNFSIRELSQKYKIGTKIISDILGDNKRTLSESSLLAKLKFPEKNKHTEDTKQRLREIRLNWMRLNPDKTAWRTKKISYPEKLFLDELTLKNWDKKYSIVREYSIFPYYIDFAFLNEMVAVEIDGSQHLEEKRKINDNSKDTLLNNLGWSVIRVSESEVKKNIDSVFIEIEKVLSLSDKSKFYQIGIISNPKKRQKKERTHNGLTELEYYRSIKQRKTNRPDYSELMNDIQTMGYSKTGLKYGVSDNSIRKWVKFYEKYKSH